jgi:outer membrane protein OmpA-like peptidoglycan-associated protein
MLLNRFPSLFLTVSVCLCTACSTGNRVLLLPPNGARSAVVVTTPTANIELSSAYAVAEIGKSGQLVRAKSSESEVREQYPDLLSLQPPESEKFVLNFLPGTSQLTPESTAQLDGIIGRARARSGGEIVIIGHTDRQGPAEANDALSLRRANAIRDVLIERGFKGDLIQPVGRGERDPLVPTEDDVAEPRNRRAELVVR